MNGSVVEATPQLRFVRRNVRSEHRGDLIWKTERILQQAFLVHGKGIEWHDVPTVDEQP